MSLTRFNNGDFLISTDRSTVSTWTNNVNNLTASNNIHNDKYNQRLNMTQSMRENIGLVYDDTNIQNSQLQNSQLQNSQLISNNLDTDIKYLVINSEDRDWINRTDENPYNFRVDVGSVSTYQQGSHTRQLWQQGGIYLDSPSSTSSLTYKVQWKTESSGSLNLNRDGGNEDETYITRTPSSITVMEVLA